MDRIAKKAKVAQDEAVIRSYREAQDAVVGGDAPQYLVCRTREADGTTSSKYAYLDEAGNLLVTFTGEGIRPITHKDDAWGYVARLRREVGGNWQARPVTELGGGYLSRGLTKANISFWTLLPLCGIIRTWQRRAVGHSRKSGFMRSD